MTTEDTIEAYRAAAAKLAEALATGPRACEEAFACAKSASRIALNIAPAAWGIAFLSDDVGVIWDDEPGWRWLVEAARLRLLLEALVLEQRPPLSRPARENWPWHPENQAELGALVVDLLATGDVSPDRDRGAP